MPKVVPSVPQVPAPTPTPDVAAGLPQHGNYDRDKLTPADAERLLDEFQTLRAWVGQLFMEWKATRTDVADIAAHGRQILELRSGDERKYVDLSNKVESLNGDLQLVMEVVLTTETEEAVNDGADRVTA